MSFAEIAQLVERNLAKVEVAGPSPVFRSRNKRIEESVLFSFVGQRVAIVVFSTVNDLLTDLLYCFAAIFILTKNSIQRYVFFSYIIKFSINIAKVDIIV